jgi:hypothetical protein
MIHFQSFGNLNKLNLEFYFVLQKVVVFGECSKNLIKKKTKMVRYSKCDFLHHFPVLPHLYL